MKYLITESQLDKVIFKYLDNQDFLIYSNGKKFNRYAYFLNINKRYGIYFVNSEGDEYAQIRFDKDDGLCFITKDLVNEISSFFSIQDSDSRQVIGRWVENTLRMKVINTSYLPTTLPMDS
jgi:hypothetical protein